jgi:hypothetical protein
MAIGDSASVTINGAQFILFYTGDINHGSLDVYVDGVKIDTIDEYSATTVYEKTWMSPVLAPGIHTLQFVHVDGVVVDIDAIEIVATSNPTAPGAATLISPNGNIETTNPTYTWEEVSEATSYYLWVDGPTASGIIQQWYTAGQANCNGTTCSVTPSTTLSSGAHIWWIQTWSEAGFGPWSDRMDFSIP